ncbi:MAG: fused gamma-glutamyl-gamma-aminobutyrate hydrolase/peptidase, partial [Tannerellaceae bacterium]|nr:fused gamma-glutamyl-gamma-aminobutyrate hydrolase/peptidase [Tannerellaceae bacterium]
MNIVPSLPDLEKLYKDIDAHLPPERLTERPVIGISVNRVEGTARLAEDYFRSVWQAGGVPLLIPPLTDVEALDIAVSA